MFRMLSCAQEHQARDKLVIQCLPVLDLHRLRDTDQLCTKVS
jgi:hypothetical protein